MAYEGYLAAFGLVGLKNPIDFYGEVDGARCCYDVYIFVSSTLYQRTQHRMEEMWGGATHRRSMR